MYLSYMDIIDANLNSIMGVSLALSFARRAVATYQSGHPYPWLPPIAEAEDA